MAFARTFFIIFLTTLSSFHASAKGPKPLSCQQILKIEDAHSLRAIGADGLQEALASGLSRVKSVAQMRRFLKNARDLQVHISSRKKAIQYSYQLIAHILWDLDFLTPLIPWRESMTDEDKSAILQELAKALEIDEGLAANPLKIKSLGRQDTEPTYARSLLDFKTVEVFFYPERWDAQYSNILLNHTMWMRNTEARLISAVNPVEPAVVTALRSLPIAVRNQTISDLQSYIRGTTTRIHNLRAQHLSDDDEREWVAILRRRNGESLLHLLDFENRSSLNSLRLTDKIDLQTLEPIVSNYWLHHNGRKSAVNLSSVVKSLAPLQSFLANEFPASELYLVGSVINGASQPSGSDWDLIPSKTMWKTLAQNIGVNEKGGTLNLDRPLTVVGKAYAKELRKIERQIVEELRWEKSKGLFSLEFPDIFYSKTQDLKERVTSFFGVNQSLSIRITAKALFINEYEIETNTFSETKILLDQ